MSREAAVTSYRPTRRRLLEGVAFGLPLLLAGGLRAQTGVTQDITDAGEAEAEDPLLGAALRPWTGDLDGMVERGMIRAAIPFGLTTYFLDGGDQKGLTYEGVLAFEQHLKKQLGKAASRLTLVVIPTSRDRLFPMVTEGRADLAAGTLTITPERQAIVDFSDPFRTDVREVLVTGPAAPEIRSAEDLLGTKIHVRRSSSFYEHLQGLNERRAAEGKPPIPVVEADEKLTTDDFLEMVDAGIFPATIADDVIAEFF
ncbi:MAG: transporter substrate-binding domain-containing protein, partial [Rhodospirillales bacterium]|nr:transporter substrate-binding domain-containing protein [Rhodospirillales bacterium]